MSASRSFSETILKLEIVTDNPPHHEFKSGVRPPAINPDGVPLANPRLCFSVKDRVRVVHHQKFHAVNGIVQSQNIDVEAENQHNANVDFQTVISFAESK